jgi:hypothetical protein
MKHRRSADWAKAEPELCPLIASSNELRGGASYLVWRKEARECSEYAPGSALTCQAMAHADTLRVTLNLNAQLAAVAGSNSLAHERLGGCLVPPNA